MKGKEYELRSCKWCSYKYKVVGHPWKDEDEEQAETPEDPKKCSLSPPSTESSSDQSPMQTYFPQLPSEMSAQELLIFQGGLPAWPTPTATDRGH